MMPTLRSQLHNVLSRIAAGAVWSDWQKWDEMDALIEERDAILNKIRVADDSDAAEEMEAA